MRPVLSPLPPSRRSPPPRGRSGNSRAIRLTCRAAAAALFLAVWLVSGRVWALSAASLLPPNIGAQTACPPTSCPSLPAQWGLNIPEALLLAPAAKAQIEQSSAFEAALVASGVEDLDTLRHYRAKLAAWTAELRRWQALHGMPRQQAAAIFDFLHRRVLTGGYALQCTDLRQALDFGRFNCVSASVLFNCLAAEFGLAACGLETPSHVMSRLRLPEGNLDVETTCPRWFQLVGDCPDFRGHARENGTVPLGSVGSEGTGTVSRPGGRKMSQSPKALSPGAAREVSPAELVAIIYYNRGVDLLGEKRFSEAAVANVKALQLDPANATARENLLATINNWAIDLAEAGRYQDAAALLNLGLKIEPAYEAFALNYVHLYRRWMDRLCALGQFDVALSRLAEAAADRPQESYFRSAALEVGRRQAEAGAAKP
jgi:tetratricopeptide (TPR) repeat protein